MPRTNVHAYYSSSVSSIGGAAGVSLERRRRRQSVAVKVLALLLLPLDNNDPALTRVSVDQPRLNRSPRWAAAALFISSSSESQHHILELGFTFKNHVKHSQTNKPRIK